MHWGGGRSGATNELRKVVRKWRRRECCCKLLWVPIGDKSRVLIKISRFVLYKMFQGILLAFSTPLGFKRMLVPEVSLPYCFASLARGTLFSHPAGINTGRLEKVSATATEQHQLSPFFSALNKRNGGRRRRRKA